MSGPAVYALRVVERDRETGEFILRAERRCPSRTLGAEIAQEVAWALREPGRRSGVEVRTVRRGA